MNDITMRVRSYLPNDEKDVIELWRKCDLIKSWNNPKRDIERKLRTNPELFLVGLVNHKVIATVMGGFDGHRGWIYYLAVDSAYRKSGLGRLMMETIERKILGMGCPKINLQIRPENSDVVKFYENIGYKEEERISMGKRLIED